MRSVLSYRMPPAFVRRAVRPRRLPPHRAGLVDRLSLTFEVLVSYVELLALLRREDVRTMVASARAVPAHPIGPLDALQERRLAVRIGRLVDRVLSKLPSDKRCLIKSLVVVRMLSHRGIDVRVVIGVQTDDNGFRAHAWVEHNELPVLPRADYEPLLTV